MYHCRIDFKNSWVMKIVERRERHRPPAPGPAPWLFFHHGKERKDQAFFSIWDPNNTCFKSIPELRTKRCWVSSHGWLVMSDLHCSDSGEDPCFLWNPVSLERIQLPPLQWKPNQSISLCILSSAPCDPDCMVLFYIQADPDPPFFLFCHPGDQQWIKQEYKLKEEGETLYTGIHCRNKLYALSFKNKLLVIDKLMPNFLSVSLLVSNKPKYPAGKTTSCYDHCLVESCGELFLVRKFYTGIITKEVLTLQIFRMDFSQMEWVVVECLGDRVLFWGANTTASCSATDLGLTRGCIYFILPEDKSLYAFDVEDGSISVSLPCPNLPTPWFSPDWVMPVLRLTDNKVEDKLRIDEKEEIEEKGNFESILTHEEENREIEGTVWPNLSGDILELITRYFRPVDYMHFRAVCRTCRLIAPPINWRTVSIEMEREFLSPWLMFFKKDDGICNFVDPMYNDTYLMNIPDLSDATIHFSKDGWLLMSRGDYSVFFFNPFTRVMIKLPDMSTNTNTSCFCGISFSSVPTSSDCAVFCIAEVGPQGVLISFIRHGDEDWNTIHFDNNINLLSSKRKRMEFLPYHNNPVFFHGAFYCLGQKGNLGVFDLEEIDWTVLATPQTCNSIYQNFLVDCEGELLSVFLGHLGKWVRIFRLNRSKMVWVKMESLGNHMLFISHSSCLSAVAPKNGMENKIYFPRFYGKETIFYSLETGRYHSFMSKHSTEDFYNTKEQIYCTWIEPKWLPTTDEELDWLGSANTH